MKKRVETARLYGFNKGIVYFKISQVLCAIGILTSISGLLTLHTMSNSTLQSLAFIDYALSLCYCYGLLFINPHGYYMIQVRNVAEPFVIIISSIALYNLYGENYSFDWITFWGYTIGSIISFIYFKNRKILFWIYGGGTTYDNFPFELKEPILETEPTIQTEQNPTPKMKVDEIVIDGVVYGRKKESRIKPFFVKLTIFLQKNGLPVALSCIILMTVLLIIPQVISLNAFKEKICAINCSEVNFNPQHSIILVEQEDVFASSIYVNTGNATELISVFYNQHEVDFKWTVNSGNHMGFQVGGCEKGFYNIAFQSNETKKEATIMIVVY